ncbi:MAG: ABC transporter ATP-binding protein [Lachnospiraceae bacterium]|nr:ABC transporter ATP-binding protein [Lachnospiraceae bacterium]
MLKKFISYYRPERKIFVLDMLASLMVSILGLTFPIMTRRMLNTYIPDRNIRMIIFAAVIVLFMYALRALLQFFIQYQGHMMGTRIQAQMRRDMFDHLETLPYKYYDNNETGKIMSRMTNDLQEISELAHHGPENLIISTITIVLSLVYLCTINVWLTILVFSCVPILFLITLVMQKKMRQAFAESRKAIAQINASVESSVQGIRVTKAYNNADKEREKFEAGNERYIEARRLGFKAMGQFGSSTQFVTSLFNIVVLLGGGLFMYAGKIDFADYSAFFLSVNLFINPVTTLINFMEQYQNGVTGFERFIEILNEKPETDDEQAEDAGVLRGEIEFRDVSYSYDDKNEVLEHINMKIGRGKKYALVGPSGGGKTTICHLIPHFYDIQEGEILIDGKDIREYTMESLRRNIGIVQQDIYLFNASVRDNILYGRLSATDEEVIEAAKRANIHDYILQMPQGYDTEIGERGVRLSGGQKQRLSIARVFLKDPSILVLDEATSALDNTTELMIQQSLDELCKGRTTIVVAHRLSTIKNADEIAVISRGQIVEQGTHEELMEKNGEYAALYRLQFRDQETENPEALSLEIG